MKTNGISRRRFIKLGLGTIVASGTAVARGGGKAANTDVLSIIHTTDLHGNVLPTNDYDGNGNLGGLARCATQIKRWRKEFPNHAVIDAGDLYQGTEVGFRTKGSVMIDSLNHLNFDSWSLGNHEFDWGAEAMEHAVKASQMPVLAANSKFEGASTWQQQGDGKSIFKPYYIKQVGEYRLAFIGLTTPGMKNWFLPEMLGGFEAVDPLPVFNGLLDEVEALRPDAIILVTHMGVRPNYFADDEANRLGSLTRACLDKNGNSRIAAIIAGHTHQHMPHEIVNQVSYTQAAYFGIELGLLKLHFDKETRKLQAVEPTTKRMDASIELDPGIVSLTKDKVEEAEAHLDQAVGIVAEEMSHRRQRGSTATDIERLIGSSILYGMAEREQPVDAAYHGMLFSREPWPAGEKTIRSVWEIIPFENFIVTAEFDLPALKSIVAEGWRSRRAVIGFEVSYAGRGDNTEVTSIKDRNGKELRGDRTYRIAFNSYDAAGGGGRLTRLSELILAKQAKKELHPLQSRALLVDFIKAHSPLTHKDFLG